MPKGEASVPGGRRTAREAVLHTDCLCCCRRHGRKYESKLDGYARRSAHGGVKMNMIAAVDRNWAIGRKGRLLVSIPNDLKHFREETMGKVVVLGRKT